MKPTKQLSVIIILLLSLLASVILSLAFGSRSIPFQEVIKVIRNFNQIDMSVLNHIVIVERIPRTVFALLAGAALAVSGTLMQSITRNPIADPSILGVNTGAALSVVIGIVFFQIGTSFEYIWFALFGASVTAFFVFSIGSLGVGGATPIKLALAGAATSAALSSFVSALILPRTEAMNQYRFWQVGSVGGATWESIGTILPFILIGFIIALIVRPSLDALALGEEMAKGLGARVGVIKFSSAFAGILLCGAITAIAGPIGFVGLMVPHIIRLITGPSLKWLIPISALGGGVLLTLADVIGRIVGSPGELEAGIVTAFIGAPILIYIAVKAKVTTI